MTRQHWRTGGVAVFVALAAAGVAGCGGSSSPHVASLSNSGAQSSVSTTTLPKGNPTQLLDEWATCMRAHGVPNLVDPTITATGAIHITMPAGASASTGKSIGGLGDGSNPCENYLQAAASALRGGKPLQKPDPAKVLKYSQCMQKNGFPQFPDPSAGGLSVQITPGSPMNPNNPAFINTSKMCSQKAGVPGLGDPGSAPAGSIQVQAGSGPNGGPGGNGGSGAVIGSGNGSGSGGINQSNGGSGG